MDSQGNKRRRKIAEIYNRLSKVHERYRQTVRQTDDRQTDGRATANSGRVPLNIRSFYSYVIWRLVEDYPL